MPIDPRRAGGGSPQIRDAQRFSELERRLTALERGSKGSIMASGIVEQTGSFSLPPLTYNAITGMSLSLTAQVPTVVVLAFTGTIQSRATVTLNTVAEIQLYKNGSIYSATNTAELRIAPFAPATNDIRLSVSIAHAWRVSLSAGTSTLALYGGGTGDLSAASLTYIQSRT